MGSTSYPHKSVAVIVALIDQKDEFVYSLQVVLCIEGYIESAYISLDCSVRLSTLEDGDTDAHLIPPSPANSPLLHHPPDPMSRTVGCVNGYSESRFGVSELIATMHRHTKASRWTRDGVEAVVVVGINLLTG